MKKQIKIILMIMMIFVLSCQGGADDPKFFYGGQDLLDLVDEAWGDFTSADSLPDYVNALNKFIDAKNTGDALQSEMDPPLIHSTFSDIHTGIGWCHLRLLHADIARDNFIISKEYEEYSFGASVGLMAAYFELGNKIPIDIDQVNLAIDWGRWIFSSGMPEAFEYDLTINVSDVKLLMARSYYTKGDLSNNTDLEAGALYWILQLDSGYADLDANDPDSWHLYENQPQLYDSFDEIILMILRELESEVFPA